MNRTRRSLVIVVALVGMLAVPAAAPAQGQWWDTTPETNKDLPPGLTPYHEIAPKLRDIQRISNRVQVEVIGQSAQGRDLYLVTVSDPSAQGRFGRYKALRNLMLRDPARAQQMAAEFEDFKVPVFVNGSIHGNEWEGVDASLALIERLAFSKDAQTRKILDNTIVLFNVVQNPDGRVLGQRANGNGFDVNRDFITLSQPEARATVEQMIEWHPMVLLDLHGYVDPYLIEPTTPPHNPNYEYDLYIKWALAQAKAMEDALNAMGLDAVIPFRDWTDGWDDWPPIFTPMYAMYHGAYGHTMEAPLRVNGTVGVNLPADERRRSADINKRAHMATVWAALNYASDNRREMVRDQIEIFRRGFLEEPQVPIGDEYGEQHEFLAEFPEAYVLPMGDEQRSEVAAVELVNHLVDNDVEVQRAATAFTAGGQLFPAGSYIVPMQQPKRGLANTILEPGYDITDVLPVMYDISGWSLGELWGGTRTAIPDGEAVDENASPVKQHQAADGTVEPGAVGYALLVDTPAAVRAVNALLDAGVALRRTDDGRVYVPASARTQVQRLASAEGLDFVAATAPSGAEPVEDVEIAAAASADERFVLDELGFQVDRISTDGLNGGAQLDGYDALYVSVYDAKRSPLNAAAKQEVQDFRAAGGGVVGRGSQGADFNADAAILDVDHTVGPEDANGIGRVDNLASSPVTSTAPDQTFVYWPVWFTDAGPGVQIAQRFEGGDFFFSGHWLGQEGASGQAVVVHGESGGGRAVLFGSHPLFRAHPRGLFPQAAHAIWWGGSE
jgi:hypothetical protein